MARRIGALLFAIVLLLLVAEGALSLFGDRSLTGRKHTPVQAPPIQTDADRFSAALRSPGPYRIHEDPLVAYVFKSNTEVEHGGRTIATDELGMRARPGPPPPADAYRILVLGDSVAFGTGLPYPDILSAQIETLLKTLRGAGAPEVVCLTAAVPGWNFRNAIRFTLDHLDRLAPDLVLYVTVENDIEDANSVYETGHRRLGEDLGSPDPLLPYGQNFRYFRTSVRRLSAEKRAIDEEHIGPYVHNAGLTPSSSRRLDEMAAVLVDFQARLAERGAPLVLVPFFQHEVHRQVRARLARMGAGIPVIPLLEDYRDEDGQETDAHPSTETTRSFALWTVGALIERGLLPGAWSSELPAVSPRHAGRRARELSADELADWRRDYETAVTRALEPRIVHDTLQGVRQIYGGINMDGSLGAELLVVLPAGRTLEVELAALEERPDLYPLAFRVDVDGEAIGEVVVPPPGDEPGAAATFTLPEHASEHPFEVRLVAERWALGPVKGQSTVRSAHFVSISSLEQR